MRAEVLSKRAAAIRDGEMRSEVDEVITEEVAEDEDFKQEETREDEGKGGMVGDPVYVCIGRWDGLLRGRYVWTVWIFAR